MGGPYTPRSAGRHREVGDSPLVRPGSGGSKGSNKHNEKDPPGAKEWGGGAIQKKGGGRGMWGEVLGWG